MIDFTLDTANSILHIRPRSALAAADFAALAAAVDPHIESTGKLAGLIVEIDSFPGWNSLHAMAAHFRFVRDHHQHVRKVALVTDFALGDMIPRLASHFIAAEIKHFPAGQFESAKQWILR